MKNLFVFGALTVCSILFSFENSNACNLIRGSAVLTPIEGSSNMQLTCPSGDLCAKRSCEGNGIDIYINNGVIHGTVVKAIKEEEDKENPGYSTIESMEISDLEPVEG